MSVKRFIAGAICPRCKQLDKIQMYTDNEKQFRECVACDFQDEIRLQPQQRELDTRVNQTDEEKKQAVSRIKIIDLNRTNKS